MSYIIVTSKATVVSPPFHSYETALTEASRLFGDDVRSWMDLNLRIEETRKAA